jgi:hypothetical protein
MEAEKKARELVDKMLAVYDIDNIAIDCALIAVDELISHSRITAMIFDLSFDESTCYWNKVKKEIEKL